MPKGIDKKLAWFVSTIGHPVLLVSAFVIQVNYQEFGPLLARNLSLAVLGFVVLPLCAYILIKMKRGEYNNFDVSNRKSRNSLYPFILLLQVLLLIFIWLQDYSWLIKAGLLSSLFLVLSAFLLNQRIKVSLHTSIAFYLAILLIYVEIQMAFSVMIFAVMIAWSRVLLGRHSVPEIIIGLLLGLVSGSVFHFLIYLPV